MAITQICTAHLNPTEKYYYIACLVTGCDAKINVLPKTDMQRRSCRKCATVYNFSTDIENQSGDTAKRSGLPYTLRNTLYIVVAAGPNADTAAQVAINAPAVEGASPSIDMTKIMDQMESRLRQEIKNEVQSAIEDNTPNAYHINIAGQIEVRVQGGRHAQYEEVMRSLLAIGQVALVGPPGSGKSSLVKQIAEDLGKGYSFNSCTEGMSLSHILGSSNPFTNEYFPSAFVKNFEGEGEYDGGGIHLWDECDALDANTSLAINEALSNGLMSVPARHEKPIAVKADGFYQAAAMNTYGTGTSIEMSGRNALDAAFMDRFVGAIIFIDYDLDRERAIAAEHGITSLLEIIWKIRKNVLEQKMRRPVSTRVFLHLGRLNSGNRGVYTKRDLLDRFFTGWTTQEKEKALRGIDVDAELRETAKPASTSEVVVEKEAKVEAVVTASGEVVIGGGGTPICPVPTCGAPMVKRLASKGRMAGHNFWGCSKFGGRNSCMGTRQIRELV